jgi:hypothetical protein
VDVDWNATRIQPRGADHVESFFLKANDPEGDRALWIKATLFVSSREPSRVLAEGWAIMFDRRPSLPNGPHHVAVKCTRPFAETSFSDSGLDVQWEGFSLTPGQARGAISTREHTIEWDLELAGELSPIVPFFHPSMYRGRFPKSKLVTPYPDLVVSGRITADGTTHTIDRWRGMQGHNWGRGHADLYAWSHCNVWDQDEDFILEALSGQVKVGPILTPLITIACVRHRGVKYDFNAPRTLLKARGDVTPRHFSFTAETTRARIEGSLDAGAEDMVGLYYANPNGQMTYCLNSKLAAARIRFESDGRAPLELTSRAAALEVGTHNEDHGVRMYV